MTGHEPPEPTLAEVQAEFPGWLCTRGTSQLYYARHLATGTRVQGEDPLDLRDMIRGAEARLSWDQPGGQGSDG